ncbi:unnamed protein product [Brachionus calyciflorus]|uniref:Uncharacterized protein n=1 Tax=Brachionus calyciflorus TaxID=104777 RepID=A0A813M408_9BILA|nr:unnamed protein product [Brachionus calyciflorus]
MSLTNVLLILSLTVWLVCTNPLSELNEPRINTIYNLICSNDKSDCDLVAATESKLEREDSVEQIKQLGSFKIHSLNKRLFPLTQGLHKIHKNKDINCITQDCKWFMTKDKRAKNGVGTLTCLGDPYSNGGSRCVPIEGLYIG